MQAIFINPLWKSQCRSGKEGYNVSDLENLKIPISVMKSGIIFVSCEKDILGSLMDIMDKKGF